MASHRAYAGWSMTEILAEMDRRGIDRDRYAAVLLERRDKSGRWCAVETLVRSQRGAF